LSAANLLGWWAPWLGVILFGVAVSVYFSAPLGTLPWIMLVLLAAWTGQLLGGELIGQNVGGFFGALVMTPVATLSTMDSLAGSRHVPPGGDTLAQCQSPFNNPGPTTW
jgi:uncharacterized membrane protein YjjB (DUF3815 family)